MRVRGGTFGCKALRSLAVCVALVSSWCVAGSAEDVAGQGFVPHSRDELKKMKGKELQSLLWERGQECHGCAEKDDFVDRVLEVQDMPVIQKRGQSSTGEGEGGRDGGGGVKEGIRNEDGTESNPYTEDLMGDGSGKPKNVEEILAKMNEAGFGAKVFTREDMAKMGDMNDKDFAKMFGDGDL